MRPASSASRACRPTVPKWIRAVPSVDALRTPRVEHAGTEAGCHVVQCGHGVVTDHPRADDDDRAHLCDVASQRRHLHLAGERHRRELRRRWSVEVDVEHVLHGVERHSDVPRRQRSREGRRGRRSRRVPRREPGWDPSRSTCPGNAATPGPRPMRPDASASTTASAASSTRTWVNPASPDKPESAEPNTRVAPRSTRQRARRSRTVPTVPLDSSVMAPTSAYGS